MDIQARRNAFGRQVRSFEADLDVAGFEGPPLRAVFIRSPWIAEHGDGVEILASVDGHAVAARQGSLLAVAFHPELGADTRLHERFLASVRG
jgi:5'-phosphate synthase pdxT subunit